jgi:hypothetical protein
MNPKSIIFLFFLTLSCQGPWSYYPEEQENYQGIWTYAYIISGRPVEDVCFDKMHALTETRMHGFAFYESASIKITGSFNGKDTSFFLNPNTQNFANKPNCFVGPIDLLADIGGKYEIDASIVWDSAGKRTTSNFHAKTYIPQKFKVIRAYDLSREPYNSGDTVQYLPPPMDFQSNYFIPEYSDDVSGALVSMIYGKDVLWGENSVDKIVGQFSETSDTARHAKFGDREIVYIAANRQIANANKDIDSIPIMGLDFPAIGSVRLLFYAATPEFMKYYETHGSGDSRTKAIYNIQGGAGIFSGMLVDTFEVNIETSPDLKTYSYADAQWSYCDRKDEGRAGEGTGVKFLILRRQCVEIWDKVIWTEILCGKNAEECNFVYPPWDEIPPEKLKKMLSTSELITWCEHRNFPIEIYPLCGTALVYYSKTGKSSPILDREVNKWCEEHNDDEACKS